MRNIIKTIICYDSFGKYEDTDNEVLCLHLFSYIASWGMLCNSFLLDYDYLFNKGLVEIITRRRFMCLRGMNAEQLIEVDNALTVIELYREIKQYYIERAGKEPSDTLITKIMLGTVGCIPAYDTNAKKSLRMLKSQGITQTVNVDSFINLCKWYSMNKDEIDKIKNRNEEIQNHPDMKILDAILWQMGEIEW